MAAALRHGVWALAGWSRSDAVAGIPAAALAAWAGLIIALYGVIMGMTQSYAKTILAYSSVSQMGVVTSMLGMALSAGDPSVGADAAFYAMHHLFAKGGLFLAVGLVAATGLCRKWCLSAARCWPWAWRACPSPAERL